MNNTAMNNTTNNTASAVVANPPKDVPKVKAPKTKKAEAPKAENAVVKVLASDLKKAELEDAIKEYNTLIVTKHTAKQEERAKSNVDAKVRAMNAELHEEYKELLLDMLTVNTVEAFEKYIADCGEYEVIKVKPMNKNDKRLVAVKSIKYLDFANIANNSEAYSNSAWKEKMLMFVDCVGAHVASTIGATAKENYISKVAQERAGVLFNAKEFAENIEANSSKTRLLQQMNNIAIEMRPVDAPAFEYLKNDLNYVLECASSAKANSSATVILANENAIIHALVVAMHRRERNMMYEFNSKAKIHKAPKEK